jgi:hypothetical protein
MLGFDHRFTGKKRENKTTTKKEKRKGKYMWNLRKINSQ